MSTGTSDASFWTFGVIAIGACFSSSRSLAATWPFASRGYVGPAVGPTFLDQTVTRERAEGRCQTLVLAIGDDGRFCTCPRLMRKQPTATGSWGWEFPAMGSPGAKPSSSTT